MHEHVTETNVTYTHALTETMMLQPKTGGRDGQEGGRDRRLVSRDWRRHTLTHTQLCAEDIICMCVCVCVLPWRHKTHGQRLTKRF